MPTNPTTITHGGERYVRLGAVLAQLKAEAGARLMGLEVARRRGPDDRIARWQMALKSAESCLESVRSEFEEPDEPGPTDEADVRETARLNRAADAAAHNAGRR